MLSTGTILEPYVPKPGKAVTVISSMHHDKAVEGNATRPSVIVHYNATKSGVDHMDHRPTVLHYSLHEEKQTDGHLSCFSIWLTLLALQPTLCGWD